MMVGVPMLTVPLETVAEPDALARLTPTNAAPAAAAATAARMIHFLWLPEPILIVVGVISPDFALIWAAAGCVAVIWEVAAGAVAGCGGGGWDAV